MKKIFVCLLACLCITQLIGGEILTDSKLVSVTVYRVLAKENRTANVSIPKGNSEIVISNVSMNMQEASLQVGVKGNASLLSATTRVNYFSKQEANNDLAAKKMKDSLQEIDDEIAWLLEQKSVYTGELALLNVNNKLGSEEEGLIPDELIELTDVYRKRAMEIKKELFELSKNERILRLKREKYQGQYNELNNKQSTPVKELVLSVYSETGGALNLKCSYLVASAGWTPMYDIKVENTNKPVNLDYKGKIYQNTGFDWRDAKITLSTGNPTRDNNRPIMNPKFVDFTYYAPLNSYDPAPKKPMQMMEKSNMAMDLGRDGDGVNEPYREGIDAFDYGVNVKENDINVEFEIDITQTIPSDGKEHIVGIKTFEVPATYKYHVVPKLDPAAFLLAKITDYGKYNLLAGNANIFFEDMYVGQVAINPNTSGDTLLLSLGKDDKVVVKRTKLVDKTSSKIIGQNKKETYAWETIIRNNKMTNIEIEILDQVPISKQKEIEVELLEYDGAQYTEDYGKLLWNITLKPNESKKIKLVYSIKFPQDKTISEY